MRDAQQRTQNYTGAEDRFKPILLVKRKQNCTVMWNEQNTYIIVMHKQVSHDLI